MFRRLSTQEWIDKAKLKFGDKFDYSKVDYLGQDEPIIIGCPTHGEFVFTPKKHLRGCGCPQCAKENRDNQKLTSEEFIKRAKKIHGNKYDYSLVKYKTNIDRVDIICKKHGVFRPIATNHLCGVGCKKCFCERQSLRKMSNTDEFIRKSQIIFGINRYIYDKVHYTGSKNNVIITCPIHGDFLVTPNDHLSSKNGCPRCSMSKLETSLETFLQGEGIEYVWQYKSDWLGQQSLDFYLPQYNIAIECQGKQHFEPFKHFGGEKGFLDIQRRDKLKASKCKQQKINLLYYSNLGIEYPYRVFENKDELLNEITKYRKQWKTSNV